MSISAGTREILIDGDFRKLRRCWAEIAPHLAGQGPQTDAEAEIVLHHSRTQAASVPFKHRAYSHRWLSERGHPSGLPDGLKPKAERMYPVIAEAVAIAVKSTGDTDPLMREAGLIVRKSMETEVETLFADGMKEPRFVRSRMLDARDRTRRQLFGTLKGMTK